MKKMALFLSVLLLFPVLASCMNKRTADSEVPGNRVSEEVWRDELNYSKWLDGFNGEVLYEFQYPEEKDCFSVKTSYASGTVYHSGTLYSKLDLGNGYGEYFSEENGTAYRYIYDVDESKWGKEEYPGGMRGARVILFDAIEGVCNFIDRFSKFEYDEELNMYVAGNELFPEMEDEMKYMTFESGDDGFFTPDKWELNAMVKFVGDKLDYLKYDLKCIFSRSGNTYRYTYVIDNIGKVAEITLPQVTED